MQRNWHTGEWEDVTERNNLEQWSKTSILQHVGRGQLEEINRLFLNMASYICWEFSERAGETYGSTVAVPERRPETQGLARNFRLNALSPSFLVELRIMTASTILEDRSSHLRQVFLLPNILLLELSHGVILATSEWIESVHEQPAEPFVENDREAEAGYAWEMAMYGGPPLAIAYRANCSHGLKACRWPGIKEQRSATTAISGHRERLGDRLGTKHGLCANILHESLLGAGREARPIVHETSKDARSRYWNSYGRSL